MAEPLKPDLALEILAYLTHRPEAQDTLEGIVGWWVANDDGVPQPRGVRAAVEELVAAGFLLATRGRDGQVRYRLNPALRQDAAELAKRRRSSRHVQE